MKFKNIVTTAALFLSFSANAAIITTFTDDFESGLGKWTGKSGGSHDGIIVVDPLDSSNKVLTFTSKESAGEIFTIDQVSTSSTFKVSFDYLGTCTWGDCGGYFGVSLGLPGSHYWVAGTGSYSTPIALIDDGTWHHYELEFTWANNVHFMLEDWVSSPGPAGDMFFDNLSFYDVSAPPSPSLVPEPSTIALMGLGVLGLGFSRRKMK